MDYNEAFTHSSHSNLEIWWIGSEADIRARRQVERIWSFFSRLSHQLLNTTLFFTSPYLREGVQKSEFYIFALKGMVLLVFLDAKNPKRFTAWGMLHGARLKQPHMKWHELIAHAELCMYEIVLIVPYHQYSTLWFWSQEGESKGYPQPFSPFG